MSYAVFLIYLAVSELPVAHSRCGKIGKYIAADCIFQCTAQKLLLFA